MKIKHLFSVSCLAFTVFAARPSVEGALLAYDGFDYETGSLAGQAGGTGWVAGGSTTSWAAFGTSLNVVSPGLSYTGFSNTGNAAQDDSASALGNTRIWSDALSPGEGDEIWFSLQIQIPNTSGDFRFHVFTLGPDWDGSGAAGLFMTGGSLKSLVNGNLSSDAFTLSTGVTHLIVGRITFSDTTNQDAVTLWLDPVISGTTVPTGGITALGEINSGRLATPTLGVRGGGSFNGGTFDEIRIGTAYADVVAVPEPATLTVALAGLGVLGLVRRKRS
jgi:hypothetical protein